MIIKIAGILRMLIICCAFYFGYSAGYSGEMYDAAAQIHIMSPLLIIGMAGISGLEGLFFGEAAAQAKGFETGSNYQRQSALAMLGLVFAAVVVWVCNWGLKAELSVLAAFLFFFTGSAINHAIDAVVRRNYKWQNINRPFLTALVLASLALPVATALKSL